MQEKERAEEKLLEAAEAGDLPLVRALVAGGANVDAADASGETALMKASWEGHLDVVRFLTVAGVRLDATDRVLWETALMHAAVGGYVDVVCFLADSGADLGARDRVGGRTALMQAAFEGHIDVIRCLAERGADLDVTDRTHETALLVAAKNNRLDVVQCLVALGADANIVNMKGQTAIRVAANRGNQEVRRTLTQFIKLEPPQLYAMTRSAVSEETLASSWFIPPFEIELLQFVDNGNVGGDYRAKWLDADVVVKLFIADASHSAFSDQVRLWQQLRHPNVVKLYGACDAGLHLRFFVCEFASNGSLIEYVQSCTPGERVVWKHLHEAALGLEYLHERNIVHGGLRCSNILIGDDGHSKLANFELSELMRPAEPMAAHAIVGSVRWQAPERLRGESASFASDVYSLGMCILEALTQKMPWADDDDGWVKHYRKTYWDPEDESETKNQPGDIAGDARKLVGRMCCQTPDSRVSMSSVVCVLERLAANGDPWPSNSQPEQEPLCAMENYKDGLLTKTWAGVRSLMAACNDSLHQLTFQELRELRERIQSSPRPDLVHARFLQVLVEFRQMIVVPTHVGRVMRLSATRATNNSLHAFHRHVRQLWGMVDESTHAASKREARWVKQRSQQIELFVSEESKRWLVLNELQSAEQRIAFLSFMKAEMDVRGTNYTSGQLEVMKEACSDIARQLNSSKESSTTPKWFIPWYELRVDTWSCLGAGGFGSVYRAKWLDSDVVVKEVNLGGPGDQDSRFTSDESEQVVGSMTRETATTKRRRAAALEMFQHEVNIWFGFSHPHVVRLFGACHVGRPFFVCEYATNGTLINYIHAHPDQAWKKLLEAALGVQYLHARGVIHGDLKGNNVVIGGDGKAKVTDFGLSLGTGGDDESSLQISGASHWLAPECLLGESSRPTIKSDIYSLGMCIVEAMRVVEATQRAMDTPLFPFLPWGNLDNATVKVHVKNGELPIRPTICTDKQWGLVERMCRFQPDKRVKISTVVDELARIAAAHPVPLGQTVIRKPCQCAKKPTNNAPQTSSDTVQAMRQLLERVRHDQGTDSAHNLIIGPVYELLWDRIASVQHHMRGHRGCEHADSLNEMRYATRASTEALQAVRSTLTQLTEATLGGYALHRRLDKFVDAVFLPLGKQDTRIAHDWKARCYELLGISLARDTASPALDDAIAMKASWRCWCMSISKRSARSSAACVHP